MAVRQLKTGAVDKLGMTRSNKAMLGPLPTFYRVVVSVCALLSFVGIGAWLAYLMPDTFVASIGTGLGLGLGVVAVLLLLHDPQHHDGQGVRVRSHRHH